MVGGLGQQLRCQFEAKASVTFDNMSGGPYFQVIPVLEDDAPPVIKMMLCFAVMIQDHSENSHSERWQENRSISSSQVSRRR